jgi:predicted amidophosphoribosyltransferase
MTWTWKLVCDQCGLQTDREREHRCIESEPTIATWKMFLFVFVCFITPWLITFGPNILDYV